MLNREQLKQKLLDTNCFCDNEWMDKYLDIIYSKCVNNHIKYETAKHHIIPKFYFKQNNLEIDNSKNNLIELFHIDHAKAHLYLSLCSSDNKTRSSNASSMWFIIGLGNNKRWISEQEVDEFLLYIDSLSDKLKFVYMKDNNSSNKIPLRWYTNGEIEIYLHLNDNIPQGFKPGRLKSIFSNINTDTVWINNGIEQKHISIEEALNFIKSDNNWIYGMLDRGDEWKANIGRYERTPEITAKANATRAQTYKEHPERKSSTIWKPGQKAHNKGKKSITNGVKNKYITLDEYPYWEQQGWCWGNTQNHKKH